MTDDDEFEFTDRPCKIVIRGVCDAPANGGTRARCTFPYPEEAPMPYEPEIQP